MKKLVLEKANGEVCVVTFRNETNLDSDEHRDNVNRAKANFILTHIDEKVGKEIDRLLMISDNIGALPGEDQLKNLFHNEEIDKLYAEGNERLNKIKLDIEKFELARSEAVRKEKEIAQDSLEKIKDFIVSKRETHLNKAIELLGSYVKNDATISLPDLRKIAIEIADEVPELSAKIVNELYIFDNIGNSLPEMHNQFYAEDIRNLKANFDKKLSENQKEINAFDEAITRLYANYEAGIEQTKSAVSNFINKQKVFYHSKAIKLIESFKINAAYIDASQFKDKEFTRSAWRLKNKKLHVCPEAQLMIVKGFRNKKLEELDKLELAETLKPDGDASAIKAHKQRLRDLPEKLKDLTISERIKETQAALENK